MATAEAIAYKELTRQQWQSAAEAWHRWGPTLEAWLGEREARWLHDRARGVDDTPVESRDEAKSISREETFPRDLHDDDALGRELLRLAVRASADLRHDGLRARTVTVKLRDADFTTRQASRTLDAPIESERAVVAVARTLLRRLRVARRTGARLLGVALSQLTVDDGPAQLPLFAPEPAHEVETARDRALAHAVDDIRARFGDGAIVPAKLLE
jgi:DNA polymerase-4